MLIMEYRFLLVALMTGSTMVGCAYDPVEEEPVAVEAQLLQTKSHKGNSHGNNGNCDNSNGNGHGNGNNGNGNDCGEPTITRNEYTVSVKPGTDLRVYEHYTKKAQRRSKSRAVLFLPATLVTNLIWNADVPNAPEFNALDRAAGEGYYSYTLDYEGYGNSTHPADGASVTAVRTLEELGEVVEWIRQKRGVSKVDLVGSSLGSSLAVALGGVASPIPPRHIGRIVLTAHVYKTVTPFAAAVLLSPETKALLEAAPNGYVDSFPEMYGIILASADPLPAGFCFTNCPGHYATGPTLSGFDLPVFAADLGRAPMLQFWGDQDLITPPSDVDQFQDEYGGPANLEVLEGGGHVPHWESVRDTFWEKTFEFLDPHSGGSHHNH